ncbi:hypothetical protein CHS0354_025529 [Potamilus streckersoni]|uniref:Uncharacterized protein n=1 Tax=Potamilus streckersoni TaxID=2493646 RepID=A0AAE0VWX8_9BIVA|nr:hypothetical protein CHS0354_025529 [Potamilus streckersoni]
MMDARETALFYLRLWRYLWSDTPCITAEFTAKVKNDYEDIVKRIDEALAFVNCDTGDTLDYRVLMMRSIN